MRSLFLLILWFVMALAVAGIATWYLAFSTGDQVPEFVSAPVKGPIQIDWIDGRDAVITLADPADFTLGLGVAHGLGRPWLMALYRQAALGRLSEWFGPETIGFDLHARTMQLAVGDSVLGRLTPEARRLLEEYARGVRAAQGSRDWSLQPVAVGLGFRPEPWVAAHSVSVERLLAGLATPIPEGMGPRVDSLAIERDHLAAFLGLSGLSNAAVWTIGNQGLFARLTLGDSGIPPVMTVLTQVGSRALYEGATLPGTPYPFCGRSPTGSWCKPQMGTFRVGVDSTRVGTSFFQVRVSDGSRVVGEQSRQGSRLFLDRTTVTWSGFVAVSDADAWTVLPPRSPQSFRVSDALGLAFVGGGTSPLGRIPEVLGKVTISSDAPGDSLLARRIAQVADTLSVPAGLLADQGSLAPDSLQLNMTQVDSVAATYLRNWDRRFQSASIAASLFDVTMAYRESATDSLLAWFGSDRRQWRWELDPGIQLRYPAARLARLPARYGAVSMLRDGHPTSPRYGDSRAWRRHPDRPWMAASAWEVFFPKTAATPVTFRRPDVPYGSFLGRYRAAPVRPQLKTLLSGSVTSRTSVASDR